MNENFSEDDIQRINEAQQNNQIEPGIDQLLMQILMNPARKKTARKILDDNHGNKRVLSQAQEGSTINQAGFPEETISEESYCLDDGTSLCGITVCQSCGGVVKEENLYRCSCGQTCCVRKNCAKYSELRKEWYCSSWHKFLGELGKNLR